MMHKTTDHKAGNGGKGNMKKARHYVDPLEREYVRRHGKLPEYHYDELRTKYGAERAREIIQGNADAVWADMKKRYEQEKAAENPFEEVR